TQLELAPIGEAILCFGDANGDVSANASEGTAPYTYAWTDDLNNNVGNTNSVSNLTAGWYFVIATDANGCTLADSAEITQPIKLIVTLDSLPKVCSEDDPFLLTGGLPYGGTYAGIGVNSNTGFFDPYLAGAGLIEITYTYSNTNGCTDSAKVNLEVEDCFMPAYCTYTQGYYGETNGKACDTVRATALLSHLLSSGPIVIGEPATSCSNPLRSFTITQADTLNVAAVLPAGGPSKVLDPVNGSCSFNNWQTKYNTVFVSQSSGALFPPIKQGKKKSNISNTLVGQTMALSFNLRGDSKLGSLELIGDSIHTEQSTNCTTAKNTPGGDAQIHYFPVSVRNYLGLNNTVSDLLMLANSALSGSYTPVSSDPTLSEITQALGTINEAFDECRVLMKFTNSNKSNNVAKAGIVNYDSLNIDLVESYNPLNVSVRPNPFKSEIRVIIKIEKAGNANVQLINYLGQSVYKTIVECKEGENIVTINTENLKHGAYIVNVISNNYSAYKKVIKQN
ncbi:MAG: hypothetical protein ACJAX3_001649, partial [Patiriisocius sp.]